MGGSNTKYYVRPVAISLMLVSTISSLYLLETHIYVNVQNERAFKSLTRHKNAQGLTRD